MILLRQSREQNETPGPVGPYRLDNEKLLVLPSGRGSPDSWTACHEFEPSTADDPPCRGSRCELNVSRLKCPPVGVMWKLGQGVASSRVVLF
ncbi:hypothetical protein TNCV_3949301 [Trichonephila clavipes]|nr:hypothetical protein TNCV_3949301 [Trichonephila clavipes]